MFLIKLIQKTLFLFNPRERLQLIGLFVMVLVGAGLEIVGIGLVFPFVSLLSNPEAINQQFLLSWLDQLIGNPDQRVFLLILSGLLVFIVIGKNIYLAILFYFQFKFILTKRTKLSYELYQNYLISPYSFHLQRNTAQLLQNMTEEVNRFFGGVLTSLIRGLTQSTITFAIVLTLAILNPIETLVVIIIFSIFTVIFYRFVREKINKEGKLRQESFGKVLREINQGLGSVKETKVLKRELFFLRRFLTYATDLNKSAQFLQILNQLPRLYLESVAVIVIISIVVLSIIQGKPLGTIAPTISLFAAAAFRLMPLINQVIVAFNTIKFNVHALDVIHNEFKLLAPYREENQEKIKQYRHQIASTQLEVKEVTLQDVYYRYPNAETDSLQGISLTIKQGESVGLVGESGAGKSTLVDVILGLLTPYQGQVLVNGENINQHLFQWQRSIGYIPQSIYLCDDTLRANVAFGLSDEEVNEEQLWDAIKAAQLEELVKELPKGLDTVVGERGLRLSGGQRQRVGISRALYHNPSVLVMDEATAALDNQTEAYVMEALEKLRGEKTIIMIAHRLSTVKDCDCLYLLQRGKVISQGTYEKLLERSCEFQAMTNINSLNNTTA